MMPVDGMHAEVGVAVGGRVGTGVPVGRGAGVRVGRGVEVDAASVEVGTGTAELVELLPAIGVAVALISGRAVGASVTTSLDPHPVSTTSVTRAMSAEAALTRELIERAASLPGPDWGTLF